MPDNKRKQQSFEYGAIILLCSTVLVKVIGAIFKIPLSNLIGDLGFGYFSSAYDLFTPIYTLAMAGLPIAVSRVVAENMATGNYRDVRQYLLITRRLFFITGFGGLAVMLVLIYPFVRITDPTGETIYSLFAIAPSLLFCCVMSTYRGYYEGLRNMYPTAVSDVTEALGKLILGFGFAYIVMKISGNVALAAAAAMLGITVGAIAAAGYLWFRFKLKGDGITETELNDAPAAIPIKKATKILILIAIPVVLSSLANSVASLVDVSMVKWQLAHIMKTHSGEIRSMYEASINDYNEYHKILTDKAIPTFLYGIRSKAFTIYNLIPTITSVLGVSALPVLASSWSAGNKKLVKQNIDSMIKFTALIAMPAGMGFIALPGGIMSLIYSSAASVEIGAPMMRVYGFAAFFAGLAIPMTSMLQAIGKQVISLRNVAIGAVLKVIVNFIFVGIPLVNIKGAAVGTFVCYLFIFLSNLLSLIRYSGVVPSIKKVFVKPFIASLVCGAAAFLMSMLKETRIMTVLSILVAAVCYAVALVALNTFEENDILSLPNGEKLLSILVKLKIIR